MSAELSKARSKLTSVGTLLKQGKTLPAVSGLYDALVAIIKGPLMKAEREEFLRLVDQAVYAVNADRKVRRIYPLVIPYTHGDEKKLCENLRALIDELKTTVMDEAKDSIENSQARRIELMQRGQAHLEAKELDKAREVLDTLASENSDNSEIIGSVAEMYIKAEMYEEAFKHLDQALSVSPGEIHLYNRIGIVLRKLSKFDIAEKYFMRAVNYAKNDSNLYFNIGRLYVDWGKWHQVERAAKLALKIRPDFAEAQKMLSFALKKQGKPEQ